MRAPGHGNRPRSFALIAAVFLLQAACASKAKSVNGLLAGPPDCVAAAARPASDLVLGCANRANLRAMVAEPADLQRGRALSPADGVRETHAIELYELGPTKTLSADSPAPPTTGSN